MLRILDYDKALVPFRKDLEQREENYLTERLCQCA